MSTTTPRRGRPPLADREVLRSRALREIEGVGYENISMGAIATALGVSIRTLHRYFPAKADIVWGGIETSIEALSDQLRIAKDGLPVVDAVTDVVVGVFERNAEDLAVMRARLRLIAVSPELRANRSATFDVWRAELVALVARSAGEPLDGLAASAVGGALHAAIMEALWWWAISDDPRHPGECVAVALRALGAIASA